MKKKIHIFIVILLVCVIALRKDSQSIEKNSTECIPTFQDGDGPYYIQNTQFKSNLRPNNPKGMLLDVSGRILEKDCKTPVAGAVLDVWQANEAGIYVNEYYRGRVTTDSEGKYSFQTVMPKGYGEGTAHRPPHIHFKVWKDNTLLITSEMFFPDVKGKEGFNDAYIVRLKTHNFFGKTSAVAEHDIIVP